MDGRENLRRIEGLLGGRAKHSVCTPFKIRDIMIGNSKSVSWNIVNKPNAFYNHGHQLQLPLMHRQFRLLNLLMVRQIFLLSVVLGRKVDGRTPSGQHSPFPTISGPIQVMRRYLSSNQWQWVLFYIRERGTAFTTWTAVD